MEIMKNMSKVGIIKGVNGKFMPKATTTDMIFNPKIENVPAGDKEEAFALIDSNTLRVGDTDYTRTV